MFVNPSSGYNEIGTSVILMTPSDNGDFKNNAVIFREFCLCALTIIFSLENFNEYF